MAATSSGIYAPAGMRQGTGEMIWRTLSGQSGRAASAEVRSDDRISRDDTFLSKANDWEWMPEVKQFNESQKREEHDCHLGVTWKDLTVKGVSSDAAIVENMISEFNFARAFRKQQKSALKTILSQSHGCVKPGEMLLVLGRPGSGCTTLLNILSNRRAGYAEVTGDVKFGSMGCQEAQNFRGQIVMNTEDELFFPTLTVGQTADFATRMKVPQRRPNKTQTPREYAQYNKDFLLRAMGISHTETTKVGNEYVRGVSGGERKRVSIIEVLSTRASVFCWDNSTRGLDASTALEFIKGVRALTDILGLTSIVSLYQAGNGIYDLFDKVLVLDHGQQIYYGPMKDARPFMENLGFLCPDGANIADYLTGVTVPTERQILPHFESKFPRTANEIRNAYESSSIYGNMITEYNYGETSEAKNNTAAFKESVRAEQHPSLSQKSSLTTSFASQVAVCVTRQYQIIWGDKATFFIKQGSTLVQALIAGSLFYMAPDSSAGLFVKGGALFFSILFHSLLAMSEVTSSFEGRAILAKHRTFALYHPAAFCIAQVAADIPIIAFQISHFGIVLYFMVGLKKSADAFFTYWIVLFAITICMTAFFRAIGAAFRTFDAASKVSGFAVSALIMYCGYMIEKPKMHPWFVWLYWIDPLAYAFESILGNEFAGQMIPCVGHNLIPSGPGYLGITAGHQACSGVGGANPGADFVTGEQYLNSLAYSSSNIWRNFGIIWAWWVFYMAITIVFTCNWSTISRAGYLLVPRELMNRNKHVTNASDEESLSVDEKDQSQKGSSEASSLEHTTQLARNTSVLTWKNLSYTVKTPSGNLKLLDEVQGWVKPGMLGALMGASGAGKTTLLDVLAQRKTEGVIHGSIQVDGRPLPVNFQRSAGYCEQLDVHEAMSTVREALEFSALLRQPKDVPNKQKLEYVDTIVDLLEMHDIENTLIGKIGAGLSVEQRKRVTIGVELVSKPSILIFLDEPTSGLDGQAAYNTVRFLKKLAAVGQAVLVTIHQPSAQLFAQFDTLLLLASGGKTVYFGDIGENALTVKKYFENYGAPCPTDKNPAEHMIDVVSGNSSQGRDWSQIWLNSPEHKSVVQELDRTIQEAASMPPGTLDDGKEFALPLWDQIKLVTQRMNVSLFRNTDYVNNKFALHVGSALFNGFSFWMIGNSVGDLQLRLFTIFNFIFVAPGVIAQLQPLFIERRDIYEAREKKSKIYSWIAFVTGLIVSELPYLIICAVLYFICWYYTVGFPSSSEKAGAIFFVMLFYEFVYTGIGQFIAAYAPNAVFASLTNPLLIGILISFCGVLVPYAQIQPFWRYWIYYLNPFNYLMGSMLTFTVFDVEIQCTETEFARFDPPSGQTCLSYLADYLAGSGSAANLINPNATSDCHVCAYSRGSDYLKTLNINDYYYGWRDAAIVVIFSISSYAMVYLLMKLRTKTSKRAE